MCKKQLLSEFGEAETIVGVCIQGDAGGFVRGPHQPLKVDAKAVDFIGPHTARAKRCSPDGPGRFVAATMLVYMPMSMIGTLSGRGRL